MSLSRDSENTASSGHPAPLNPSTATSNSDDETIDLSHHKRRSIARAKIAHLAYLPPPAADFPPLSETAVTTSASSTASPQPLLLQHLDTSPRSSLLLSPAPFSFPPQAHPNQQQNQETLSRSRPSSTEGVDGSPSLPATKRHKRSHSSPRPLSPQPTKGSVLSLRRRHLIFSSKQTSQIRRALRSNGNDPLPTTWKCYYGGRGVCRRE